MLISNYGLFWQRKYVQFGDDQHKGSLLGKMSQNYSFLVDFGEQIGTYVLYDKDCIPIFVGQAGSGNGTLFTQLKHHTTDYLCDRWEYFTWFGHRKVKANGRLEAYGSGKKPKIQDAAEEYLQVLEEQEVAISFEEVLAGLEELKKQEKSVEKKLRKKSK